MEMSHCFHYYICHSFLNNKKKNFEGGGGGGGGMGFKYKKKVRNKKLILKAPELTRHSCHNSFLKKKIKKKSLAKNVTENYIDKYCDFKQFTIADIQPK